MSNASIPDLQNSPDARAIPIERVGVRGITLPLWIKDGAEQATVAEATLTVALPQERRGTHMSRFLELLEQQKALSFAELPALHAAMLQRLGAVRGHLSFAFPYFLRKAAPVSGVESVLNYRAGWTVSGGAEQVQLRQRVEVTATSLCPCSKEISRYGAHNQRSLIVIDSELAQPVALAQMIALAEENASCPIWATLKRPDEKYVTERAYENPKFVEDIVRDIALQLAADAQYRHWLVSAENFESIHTHNAYAEVRAEDLT